jgi:hypothetical protein
MRKLQNSIDVRCNRSYYAKNLLPDGAILGSQTNLTNGEDG